MTPAETTKRWETAKRIELGNEAYLALRRQRAAGYRLKSRVKQYGVPANELSAATMCDICHGPAQSGKAMSVDHCHTTGRIRGMLCGKCNSAIGLMMDDPNLLRRAASYLED